MEYIKRISEHISSAPEKFYKTTLFRGDRLMVGLNCLEPGQVQHAHIHAEQDKFYYVVEGNGRFQIGDTYTEATTGQLIWAAAGIQHGVENIGDTRLTLLVGIAPAP